MFHRPATQFAPTSRSVVSRPLLVSALAALCIGLTMAPAVAHRAPIGGAASTPVDAQTQTLTAHLVVSEVMTGGASASDEFVELYNPTAEPLPLEGLEVVYVTASGTTITRKASWSAGATSIPSGAHLLLANAAGIFATIADATYTNGIAATGGSMALRIQGAGSAVDAVGWGNATSTWLEGSPAPAPAAGSSIERLPGGLEGSGQDTDSNLVDFAIQGVPDPQNSTTPPISLPSVSPTPTAISTATPSATPSATDTPPASPSPSETASATPTPSATPSPTPIPTPPATPTPTPSATPSPTPSPSPLSIAEVRALPDGTTASIAGIALVASDFTDGGGCVTDETAGLAVLLDTGSFARGQQLSATGSIDDRYAQRTLRVSADAIQSLGPAAEPSPLTVETGAIGEATECQLVNVAGVIAGAPTSLASGLAFEIDDGSGPIRVLVAPASGIDTSAWVKDATVTLSGVAGQRDSSGTGAAGYRVLPRDPADVLSVVPAPTPTPTPTATPSPKPSPSPSASAPTPSPTPTPPPGLMTIAQARAAATGTTVHVRGTATLGTGLIDEPTAVIQDLSAAIVLRLGDDAAGMTLRRGAYLDVAGIRSTKSGMATIRADVVSSLGTQAEPAATRVTTAAAIEPYEARLLVVRGAVVATPVKSTAGNVAFSIDDGSGPLRVTLLAAAQIATNGIVKGAWVELNGVLGQQTTGAQPDRGYRLWPRENGDVQIISGALSGASGGGADGQLLAGQSRTPSGRAVKPGLSEGTDGSAPSAAAGGGAAGSSGLGDGRPDAAGGPADAAGSPADLELTSSRRRDPHLGLALLAAAGACALLFAVLGWRGGTLDRLRTIVQQVAGGRLGPDDGLQRTLVGIGGIHPVATAGGTDTGRQANRGPDIGPGSW